jgi:hypothetical protein
MDIFSRRGGKILHKWTNCPLYYHSVNSCFLQTSCAFLGASLGVPWAGQTPPLQNVIGCGSAALSSPVVFADHAPL